MLPNLPNERVQHFDNDTQRSAARAEQIGRMATSFFKTTHLMLLLQAVTQVAAIGLEILGLSLSACRANKWHLRALDSVEARRGVR